MDPSSIDEIMASLLDDDEERLRKRRAVPNVAGEGTPEQVLPLKGTFYDFSLEYYKESQMKVRFLLLPRRRRADSLTQATEADEPGSVLHNERVWRRARNETIITQTQPMKGPACQLSSPCIRVSTAVDLSYSSGRARWDEQIGFYSNDAIPNRILFHQFEPHLLAADDQGNITYASPSPPQINC